MIKDHFTPPPGPARAEDHANQKWLRRIVEILTNIAFDRVRRADNVVQLFII